MNNHTQKQTAGNHECAEYRTLSRRGFVGATAALASAPVWLPSPVLAQDGPRPRRDVLVTIFLRGAMDGLTTVVPYGDPEYYVKRPNIAIPPPGAPGGAVDLDGFFGLSPDAAALLEPYQAGDLAVIHATGSPDPSRSHFDAMRYMETATPNGITGYTSGWIGRHLQTCSASAEAYFRGVGMGPNLARSLSGGPGTIPIPDLSNFGVAGNPMTADERALILAGLYEGAVEPIRSSALNSIQTVSLLDSIDFPGYQPAHGAVYPIGLGAELKRTAALIKADTGVETIHLDLGGWDTHVNQGNYLPFLLLQVSEGLRAFHRDMASRMNSIIVVVMSEFGRRIAENGSFGTDHGHGNAMLVMGGGVNGGQVIANWPGLATSGNGDVPITIDYRDILAEIVQERLGNPNLSEILPQFTPTFHGVTI